MKKFLPAHVCAVLLLVCCTTVSVDVLAPGLLVLARTRSKLVLCLMDNMGHACIAAEIWLAAIPLDSVVVSTVERCRDKFRCPSTTWTTLKTLVCDVRIKELLGAGVVGSLLDLDHFAAAVSLSLGDATSLGARPKGHAVLFIVFAMCVTFLASSLLAPSWSGYRYRVTLLVCTSLLSHQLRDSTRRGMWLYPWDISIPVSYSMYLACLASLVCVVHYLTLNVAVFFLHTSQGKKRLYIDAEIV